MPDMRIITAILTGIITLWTPAWWSAGSVMSVEPAVFPADPKDLPPTNPQDRSIFDDKIQIAAAETSLQSRMVAVARSFLGTPYVSGTLNQNGDEEQVTVNLRELDCWTFMENSLAIALASGAARPAFDSLGQYVQQLRYWGGQVDGYASRIHYFSGWMLQAEKLGYLHNLTQEFGGVPYPKKIGYMTARPNKYPQLRQKEACQKLRQVEERLSQHQWYFIPQNRVARMEHLLLDGDIIALTSWKKDLDIAHQGFAIRKNGSVYLLHASSLHKRVVVSAQPLVQYLLSQKGQTGIMVARMKN